MLCKQRPQQERASEAPCNILEHQVLLVNGRPSSAGEWLTNAGSVHLRLYLCDTNTTWGAKDITSESHVACGGKTATADASQLAQKPAAELLTAEQLTQTPQVWPIQA